MHGNWTLAAQMTDDSWSCAKNEGGARLQVEMKVGDWNKEQLEAEVQSHDDIIAHTVMQRMP